MRMGFFSSSRIFSLMRLAKLVLPKWPGRAARMCPLMGRPTKCEVTHDVQQLVARGFVEELQVGGVEHAVAADLHVLVFAAQRFRQVLQLFLGGAFAVLQHDGVVEVAAL
jgi:hypothetical protein